MCALPFSTPVGVCVCVCCLNNNSSQIVIQKFKGADSVVRELRLQRVENVKKSEVRLEHVHN